MGRPGSWSSKLARIFALGRNFLAASPAILWIRNTKNSCQLGRVGKCAWCSFGGTLARPTPALNTFGGGNDDPIWLCLLCLSLFVLAALVGHLCLELAIRLSRSVELESGGPGGAFSWIVRRFFFLLFGSKDAFF